MQAPVRIRHHETVQLVVLVVRHQPPDADRTVQDVQPLGGLRFGEPRLGIVPNADEALVLVHREHAHELKAFQAP